MAAPPVALQAALAGIARKRQQAQLQTRFLVQLAAFRLPEEFKLRLNELLYQPDRNTLEVERKMTVKGKSPTESDVGEHKAAIRVEIEVTGRAALDTQTDKPLNMATIPSTMWFQPGVGVVRVESPLAWGWRLTSQK